MEGTFVCARVAQLFLDFQVRVWVRIPEDAKVRV